MPVIGTLIQVKYIRITENKLLQLFRQQNNIETVLETNIKSDTSFKSDSIDSIDNSGLHIYQEIEDLYIDDSILAIWILIVRIRTSPNLSISLWILNVRNAHVRVRVPVRSICTISKSKDILWHTYISKGIFISI